MESIATLPENEGFNNPDINALSEIDLVFRVLFVSCIQRNSHINFLKYACISEYRIAFHIENDYF